MTFVSELEPQELWKHFDQILTIPRGSKNEEAAAQYIISVAKRNDLSFKRDPTGNLVVAKPAASGTDSTDVTILQSHLDMVNEKNADVEHDFTRDPIRPRQEGDYLYATGTTLGSDNGIGVASSLAVMESRSIQHGPMEFLFTVDEETGLTGAAGLQPDFLKGRRLLNLDSEEEGAVYIGCAGGAGTNLRLLLTYTRPMSKSLPLEVQLAGLRGGHSGAEIHLQRGNAIKLLVRILSNARKRCPFQLAGFQGGNMHNAIPREAFAQVYIGSQNRELFEAILGDQLAATQEEFRSVDPDMRLELKDLSPGEQVFDRETSTKVLHLLNALPHGVISMSYDIPDLVETSSNLATARVEDDCLKVHISNRSSVTSALAAIQSRVAAIGELSGAQVEELEGYPGWKPNLDSPLLKTVEEVHSRILGTKPAAKAIHAGLECGIIGEHYAGMDMVSVGPLIEFPHSPDERVQIGSVSSFFRLLTAILEEVSSESVSSESVSQ